MSTSRERFSSDNLESALAGAPGWSQEGIELVKQFTFADYAHAVMFANAVAHVAEGMDHHPDLLLQWGKVTVRTHTHTAGGITPMDVELAERIEQLTQEKAVK